jgi:hypothetical protein
MTAKPPRLPAFKKAQIHPKWPKNDRLTAKNTLHHPTTRKTLTNREATQIDYNQNNRQDCELRVAVDVAPLELRVFVVVSAVVILRVAGRAAEA